jgi:hypothetical protein
MSKTPFEIRLELLRMAKEMLEQDYFAKREQISSDWNSQITLAMNSNSSSLPAHPGFPEYPNELDIIQKAQVLNNFISKP